MKKISCENNTKETMKFRIVQLMIVYSFKTK